MIDYSSAASSAASSSSSSSRGTGAGVVNIEYPIHIAMIQIKTTNNHIGSTINKRHEKISNPQLSIVQSESIGHLNPLEKPIASMKRSTIEPKVYRIAMTMPTIIIMKPMILSFAVLDTFFYFLINILPIFDLKLN